MISTAGGEREIRGKREIRERRGLTDEDGKKAALRTSFDRGTMRSYVDKVEIKHIDDIAWSHRERPEIGAHSLEEGRQSRG